MRMWNINVKKLCNKHLLGEHVEMHMFAGTINKGINIQGYLDKELVEVHNIKRRHDDIANEMIRRGFTHESNLNFNFNKRLGTVNIDNNIKELKRRCKECQKLLE